MPAVVPDANATIGINGNASSAVIQVIKNPNAAAGVENVINQARVIRPKMSMRGGRKCWSLRIRLWVVDWDYQVQWLVMQDPAKLGDEEVVRAWWIAFIGEWGIEQFWGIGHFWGYFERVLWINVWPHYDDDFSSTFYMTPIPCPSYQHSNGA